MAMLGIIKTYRSTSTDALCIMTGSVPIEILLNNKFAEAQVKRGHRPLQINQTTITNKNLMLKEKTYQFPQYNELNNLIVIDETEKSSNIITEIEIYTDGSVIEQKNNKSTTASSFTVKQDG